jgi:hypothetical protein
MFNILYNNKGTAYIGLIITLIIIAGITAGSFYLFSHNANPRKNPNETNDINIKTPAGVIKTLEQAKDDIDDINRVTHNAQRVTDETMDEGEIEETLSEDEVDNKTSTYPVTIKEGIKIFDIKEGDLLISPLLVAGEASSESGELIVELRNVEHETMVKEIVEIKAAKGEKGPFKITLNFEFSNTKEGYLAVYEKDNKNNIIEISVKYKNKENQFIN